MSLLSVGDSRAVFFQYPSLFANYDCNSLPAKAENGRPFYHLSVGASRACFWENPQMFAAFLPLSPYDENKPVRATWADKKAAQESSLGNWVSSATETALGLIPDFVNPTALLRPLYLLAKNLFLAIRACHKGEPSLDYWARAGKLFAYHLLAIPFLVAAGYAFAATYVVAGAICLYASLVLVQFITKQDPEFQ